MSQCLAESERRLHDALNEVNAAADDSNSQIRIDPAEAERMRVALTTLEAEHRELQSENDALKNELAAFDASFFDEIEDLKYKYHEASSELSVYHERFGRLGQ